MALTKNGATHPQQTAVVAGISLIIGLVSFYLIHHIFTSFREYERFLLYDHFRYREDRLSFEHPLNKDVALIAIDGRTIEEDTTPFIFWTTHYVPVMKMLIENGVSIIGFDNIQHLSMEDALAAVFDREFKALLHQSLGRKNLKKERAEEWIEELPDGVPLLEKEKDLAMLYLTRKVVLPAGLVDITTINRSIDRLTFAAGLDNMAIANMDTANDDIMVFQFLTYEYLVANDYLAPLSIGGGACLALPEKFEMAELQSFAKRLVEIHSGEPMGTPGPHRLTFKGKEVPLDPEGRLWINYKRPLDPPRDTDCVFSFGEVLKKALAGDRDYFKNNFSKKLVLIGQTEKTHDAYKTPFLVNQDKTGYHQLMSGVEIHAHTISTILDQRYLEVGGMNTNCIILLCLSLAAGLVVYLFRPLTALALNAGIGILFFFVAREIFTCTSLWLEVITPLSSLILVSLSVYLYKFMTLEKEREKIRKLFGRYVSHNVMEAILSNPNTVALGGVRRRITILFSDINGFTPISEKLTPEELMTSLNRYFDEMNAIISRYNGTIKQFVGDEIMVMYGTPMTQEDHAARAVETALDMVGRLREMKEADSTGSPGFYEVKIGIHTGEVVVGNVGSKDRTEYAAVGDNVNMTSRIEGLNKKLGTMVLISEDTYEEVKDRLKDVEFISFEPQEVKGKKKLVTVYEVKRLTQGRDEL